MDISVVVPLIFVRGPTAKCIESWTRKQKLERDRFEVVFVSPGNDPHTEDMVRQRMGAGDQLVVAGTESLYALYDIGVRAARGRIALITESHCLAGPRALRDLVELFDRTGCAAVCCRAATPKRDGYLADMEGLLFAEEVKTWEVDGHWRRVHERGFAIRSDVYAERGGFPHEYGWFSGRVFAARLHEAGVEISYARDIVVLHYNSSTLWDIAAGAKSFTYGEMRCRQREDPALFDRYFGRISLLAERHALNPELARVWLRGRLAYRPRLRDLRLRSLRELADLCLTSTFGAGWAITKSRLALWSWLVRLWALRPFGPEAGVGAFREFWHTHLVRYYRLRYLREEFVESTPDARDRFDAAHADAFVGFHELEEREGLSWRWSQPAAALRFRPMTPNPSKVTVCSAPFGLPLCRRRVALYLDGERLRELEFSADGYRLDALIRDGGSTNGEVRTLAMVCDPVPPSRPVDDPRSLGIPVRYIEFA